ncbi:hypothetical protein GQ55_5G011900 [Panicum hallii var. hallii]|uniref:Uncharacterized protein n=1 Tax=Panicum hallii var. hallii TaxID=1504633 RepID=A0A2T7DBM1_9POAL|nr:hypothetical protein GQ55_5G011900 [Panicum hallii var. hallii]
MIADRQRRIHGCRFYGGGQRVLPRAGGDHHLPAVGGVVRRADDRDEYGRLYYHACMQPTQAANLVLAQRAFNGTPDHVYPVNLQQLVASL